MRAWNDESGPVLEHRTANPDDLSHSRLGRHAINAHANTRPRHSRSGQDVTDTRALRRALYGVISATYAVEDGDKDAARVELTAAAKPAAHAYPAVTRESYALTIVFGSVLEEAA